MSNDILLNTDNESSQKSFVFLMDLDGTLISSDEIYYDVWKNLLATYNITMNDQIYYKYIQGKSDSYAIENLLPNKMYYINDISDQKDQLFIQNINKITLIDGAIEFLNDIKSIGYKICIVTNCNREVAEKIIRHTGINMYVDHLIVGKECTRPKPHPDPYLEAMKFFDVSNEKCIIFEDSKSGINSAVKSNPKCVCGIESIYDSNTLLKMGVDKTYKNYKNININEIFSLNRDSKNIKEWIARSLGVTIEQITIENCKLKGGYISNVVEITIKFSETNIANLIFKYENTNKSMLSTMAKKLDLYDREYYFYEAISPYVNINIPKFYGIVKNNNYHSVGILLENLNVNNYVLNIDLNNEPIETSLHVIKRLTEMHIKFWNKDIKKIFPIIKKHNDELFNPTWGNFVRNNFDKFEEKWSKVLNPNQLIIAKNISSNFEEIQSNLSKNNLTLCHGDVKSPNIFYKKIENGYDPYFIDWQYVSIGKGIQDVIFFIIESFEPAKINVMYDMIIEYYYNKILESGIKYDINEYRRDIKDSICYFPYFVAIWFGTTPENDLIDKNFPSFFIQRLFNLIQRSNLFNL